MRTQCEELKKEFAILSGKQKADKIWCKYKCKVAHMGVKSHPRWRALTYDYLGTIFYNRSTQVLNAFLITKECPECQEVLRRERQTKQSSLWRCEFLVHLHLRFHAEGWVSISKRNATSGRPKRVIWSIKRVPCRECLNSLFHLEKKQLRRDMMDICKKPKWDREGERRLCLPVLEEVRGSSAAGFWEEKGSSSHTSSK